MLFFFLIFLIRGLTKVFSKDLDTTKSQSSGFGLNNLDFGGLCSSRTIEFNPIVFSACRPGTAKGFSSIDLVTIVSVLAAVTSTHEVDFCDDGLTLKSNLLPIVSLRITMSTSLSLSVADIGLRLSIDLNQLFSMPRIPLGDTRLSCPNKLELMRVRFNNIDIIINFRVMTINFDSTKSQGGSFRLHNLNSFGLSTGRTLELDPIILLVRGPNSAKSIASIDFVTKVSVLAAVASSKNPDVFDLCISLEF
jgi:hypothetical protein